MVITTYQLWAPPGSTTPRTRSPVRVNYAPIGWRWWIVGQFTVMAPNSYKWDENSYTRIYKVY